ncbi:MAG TPA: AraC family transcriptional regulator ligand-binding domain-containing protein, partial [Rhodocyclaceae bacterium]|nr:AraC family transcriptional regulator ligand-binding domain-containing protein [Rhodocyclaceae bacterium]
MLPQNLSIPTYYLHQLAEELAARGVDVPRWLAQQTGVAPDQLGDASVSISFAVFRRLILEATAVTGLPDIGLRVGAKLRLNHHGVLGYAAMSSSSLRQAAEVFSRFCSLRSPLVPSHVERVGAELRFAFEEPYFLDDIRCTLLEIAVLTMKNVFDQVSNGQTGGGVAYVAFAFDAPEYASRYEETFQCPVHFGQAWTGLALPLSQVDLPLPMGDAAAFREAVKLCEREMESAVLQTCWAARVRHILHEAEQTFPSLTEVAKQLHVTPRTLHRRLIAEGSSYKLVLENARHRRAVARLREREWSIQ